MPRYASRQIALCVGLHRLIQFDLFAGVGVFLSDTGPRTVSRLIDTSPCSSVFSKFRGFSSVRASNQSGLLCEARSSRDRFALLKPAKAAKDAETQMFVPRLLSRACAKMWQNSV